MPMLYLNVTFKVSCINSEAAFSEAEFRGKYHATRK